MRTDVICLVGQKGGTGKTTTSVSIASELVDRGLRVLVVDADPQASARTWIDIGAAEGKLVPTVISMGAGMAEPGQLDELLPRYDCVVIDCPSRQDDKAGAMMRAALMVAGQHGGVALMPCGPGAMDVWALSDSIDTVRQAQMLCPDLSARIVITRKSPTRTVLGEEARGVLAESELDVMTAELRHRIAYQEAPGSGVGVAQYAPQSMAASEVCQLVDELFPCADTEIAEQSQDADIEHAFTVAR